MEFTYKAYDFWTCSWTPHWQIVAIIHCHDKAAQTDTKAAQTDTTLLGIFR